MRKLKLILITVLCLTLLQIPVYGDTTGGEPYPDETNPKITRIWGNTRYDTAMAVCKQGWTTSQNVIIVSGENYPDAIVSTPLAHQLGNAPILLTRASYLGDDVYAELKSLQCKNVYLVGGTGVISTSIESKLKSIGYKVTRYGGATRIDTALLVAKQMSNKKECVIVDGNKFLPALAMSTMAAAKNMPILLTYTYYNSKSASRQQVTPEQLRNWYYDNPRTCYIIGTTDLTNSMIGGIYGDDFMGEPVDSDNLVTDIFVGGFNNFVTPLTGSTVYAASSTDYPDGLTGGALAIKNNGLLIPVIDRDGEIEYDIERLSNVHKVVILGGQGAVPHTYYSQFSDALSKNGR
jgi:hypothetical protein